MRKIMAMMMVVSVSLVGLQGVSWGADAPTTRPAGMSVGATTNPTKAATESDVTPGRRSRRNADRPAVEATALGDNGDTLRVPRPPVMSAEYRILYMRSLFYHGRFVPVDPAIAHEPPPPQKNPGPDVLPPEYRPEANVVFRGVVKEGNQMRVLLELLGQGTKTVSIGEAVAPGLGKITRASLDDLDYEAGGKTLTVLLGQNLNGETIDDATTQPSMESPGEEVEGFSSGAPATTDTGPMAAILEKLKAKRQAELNGAGK